MEAALASGVLKVAGDKLGQLITGEFASIMGVTKDLSELQDLFGEITTWLSAVGDRAIASDPSLRWIKKVKDVAYDIDDLLYEAHLEAEKPKSLVFRFKMARKIKTIKERFAAIVKQRFEFNAIVSTVQVDLDKGMTMKNDGRNITISSIDTTKVIVGRDPDKMTITKKVIESTGEHKVSIISITGLGGLGKTTLAQLVYNDEVVQEHFKLRMWIYVSENFDIRRLMRALFESVTGRIADVEELSPLGEKIKENLKGKKFLLVLDDVWDHDMNEWEKFRSLLNVCEAGSKIVVTTRSTNVAKKMCSTFEHSLSTLSDEDSWTLFKRMAFQPASEELDPELVQIGKEILQKCGGMPLAVNALGSILRLKESTRGWMAVRDSDIWTIEENKVMMSLRLSYYHLPSHLKQCFTICSVFPKGHTIDKEQLIDQWIAHDMITPTDGVDYLEYTGNECFNTLVQMSFLQDVTENYAGRVTCRMHDLVHDLGRSILGDEISVDVPDKKTKSAKSYRYFSLIKQQGNVPPKHFFVKGRAMYVAEGDFIFGKVLKSAKHLRSITVECIYTEPALAAALQIKNLRYLAISQPACETLPEAISDIWCLQALHVTNSQSLRELPKSIGKLQKLRTLNLSGCSKLKSLPDSIGDCQMISSVDLYNCRELTTVPNSISRNNNLSVLRLGHTIIERLPSSITTLGNLEILDLAQCDKMVELPKGMKDLKKLKVLNLEYCDNLSGIPEGIEQLSRLQKLGMFVVGEGENFAKISELGNAGGIGGHLTIKNIVFVKDPDDAQKACLKHKTNLQGLSLDWFPDLIDECWSNDTEKELAVLNALEPPESGIESIKVNGYPGGQFAQWILKQVGHPRFPCLTRVRLVNLPNLKHLQGLAELPSLRELHMKNMPALESISGGPFPSLVRLEMHKMPCLEEMCIVAEDETFVDHGEGQQIQVQQMHLTIQECPKLKVKPYLPSSLEYLHLRESNEQLLLSPFCQGKGSSNDAEGLPPSFSHLKGLHLTRMTAASSSSGSGSAGRGWELLQHLTALDSLLIESCEGLSEFPESIRSLTSLRFLDISDCSNLCVLPEWLGELQSLQEMRIQRCHALHQLSESLGELRSLRSLLIQQLPCLSSLPHSLQHFTSLQELDIHDCEALHQLPECLGELRSLRSLSIWALPCLSSLPHSLQHLTSLQELKIEHCEALHQLPESLGKLHSLCMFKIWNLPGLNSLPHSLQHLTSLQELEIGCCEALQPLPESLGELRSLRKFKVSSMPGLSSLPHSLQHLTSLQELDIAYCEALQQLPESLGELRSLRMLSIQDLPCLSSLPHSLQHLTSLRDLEIRHCETLHLPEWLGELRSLRRFLISRLPGLTRLPRSMRLLTSLEELSIDDCQGLTSLPEWIQGLTALQELVIWDCPRLASRCERGKGEDWRLVSRIPRLYIWETPRRSILWQTVC